MKKKLLSGILALIFVIQIFVFGTAYAKDNDPTNNNLIKIGELTGEDYPKIDPADLAKLGKERKQKKLGKRGGGATLFSTKSPYITGQQPADPDKPKYWANVEGKLTTRGIDGGTFDWNKVLGQGAKVKLLFTQTNGNVMTGVTYTLLVDKDGTYTWKGSDGKPTYLPLYDVDGNPYTYNVQIQRNFSENVQLIIQEYNGTPKSKFRQEGDKQVATISFLDIEIQQVASTKFVSEWHTALSETERPQIEGYFEADTDVDNDFNFPKNDTTRTILRSSFVENFVEDEDNGPWSFLSSEIKTTPKTVKVKTNTQGLTFEDKNGVKTVTSGEHKFKYDFTYDVINGGKLTMTEIIPVTFDANGGKFASITEPNAEQKIVKEVDYDGTLTDKAEDPTREGKTFKGWSTTVDGKTPATDDDFKNITEKKTFYAIWENNDIKAEELTVSESFNNGTEYVNDFIPDLAKLKGQVEIKGANGVYQKLKDGDSLQILDDSGNPIADGDLKDNLYKKLKEDDATEISRNLTLKAKVNFADGTSQEVDIPIKVIKNIYEGTSTGGKPSYVPENYVKVTVDPTDKATNPQKTYYYVNPAAKVLIPGENPEGKDDNIFTKWLIDGTDTEYKFAERHQFAGEATIKAQFEKEKQGKIKIQYVNENGEVIPEDKRTGGGAYLQEKQGKIGSIVNRDEFISIAPEFEGYALDRFYYNPNGSIYTENGSNTVTYYYYKKVTTEDKSKDSRHYFKVVFDANGGEFGTEPTDKKDIYIYSNLRGIEKDVQVSFGEVREEVEKTYNTPTKEGSTFKEWQDNAIEGSKVEDSKVIEKPSDNTPETFYAHYGKASALISYLDLDGKPIADTFKIDTEKYPTEKEGKAGENIAKTVFTAETAPKFTGYKFNRIELNPANAKYAMDNKATIKIYYEKLPDVIPEKDGSGNPNEKPDGYVEVKFVPTDKAKDTTEKIFYVNPKKEVTIPIANPTAKPTYTFKEWKIGANAEGEVYTPSTPKKFTEDTTITATYGETKNIIPYDPSVPDPMVRPEGYVRVTFAADKGLKLTEQKAYYVKKNAGIKLGNAELAKPAYKEETGYKFDKWDKEDSLVIEAADIVVTAKATKLDNVIPEKKEDGTPNEKPTGYKEVTFVVKTGDEDKGSITGVAKFYVNPTEYVTINPPATSANTGYEFGTWDKDATIPTVYKEDATITGSFNELKAIIPKTKYDDSEKPAGYVTVNFVIEPAKGGKIADGEVKVYYVNPAKEVTVPQPKTVADTGYEFEKWDQDTTTAKKYTADTTVKGNFKKLDDIIPSTDDNGDPNAKPEGYVTVTFEKGDHGKEITGKTVYYVNPKADPAKTLGDTLIVKPEVKAEVGYKFTGWDTKDDFEIKDNKTVTAQYEEIADVIPKTKTDESEKPDGYITVKFSTETNGKIKGTDKTEKVVYVNPNKAVALKGFDPDVSPNTGYDFANWDTPIDKKIQYSDGDTIKALYNEKDDVIPQEKTDGSDKPAGYLTVTFDKGANGQLSGKTVYYVKPNKEVTVPAPSVTPDTGYKQKDGTEAWDKLLTQTFTEDTKITAQYDPLADVIPGDHTKPDGYFTVEFKAENGSLVGTTTYFVKPNVEVNLKDKADAITKNPEVGYTAESGFWDPTVESKTYTEDATYTFKFKKLDDIIPGDENTQRPKGYVKVEFRTDKNGILEGNTIFYVNPNANKTMKDIIPLPTIKAYKGYKVGTPNWHPDFTGDTTEITKDRIYVANYESLGESKITYIARDPEMGSVSPGSEVLSEDEPIKGSTATANPEYEFVEWVDADGKHVSDKSTFVPTEKVSAVFIAVFKPKDPMTFTAKKVWADDVSPVPTMNFTLYRKVEDSQDQPVEVTGAELKEITKTKTEATWKDLPKVDSNGKEYIYSVKESFKEEDVRNSNWILGEMVTDANGNTITNKLKTVPGTGDTPNENQHRMGKLTITKKIESKPVTAQASMSMSRAPAAPLAFTFKVTDPYGKEETFTLKAGESKELENLLYGEYTVEETDAKGLTPFVKVGNGDETKSSTAKVTLTTTDKKGNVTFTNKNVIPEENPNIIEVKATKIWVNGPKKDHTVVDLKLYRQVDGGSKEEVTDAKLDKSADVNDTSKFNYVWKNLPKINDDGKEYTYTVEEANVTDGKVKVGDNTYQVSQDGNNITNTFVVAKDDVKATKVWEGDLKAGEERPTTYFKLYRKIDDCKECQPVESAEVKELKAGTTEATWEDQDLTDENGNKYIYSVKEVDKDGKEATPEGYVKVENGLTVTNTKIAKDGKLTITKKLENEPKRMMMRAPSNSEPIKFKFTITKPDGTSEEFELKAGDSKSFEDLTYGKYIVKETQTQGYTPYFAIGEGEQTQTEKFEVTVNSKDEVKVIVTNKNLINQNDLTVRATKIWDGGPDSDHTAVTLQLLRTSAKAGSEEEDVSKDYKVEANKDETSDTITYVWKNLPNHDGEGYRYTYKVKELGVGEDKIYTVGANNYVSKVEDDKENTSNETTSFKITNTYQVPQTDDIIATKVWKGLPEGTTKPIIKFQLYRKAQGSSLEEKVGEVRDLENNQVNFGKHDKTNQNGVEYIYFVKELDENGAEFKKDNYKTSYDGLTVTNTYQQKPTPDPDKPTPDPDKPTPDPDKPTPDPDKPTPDPDKPTPDPDKPTPDPDKPTPDPDKPTPDPDKPTPDPDNPTPDPDKPTPDPDKPTPDPDKPTPDPDKPTPDPDNPTPDPDKPTPNPDGEEPGTPDEKPEPKPGDKPGEEPGDKPGEEPGDKPGEKPGDKPGEKPGNEPENGYKVVIPDKTGVKDKNHLTDEEKKKIIDKIKKVNPDVVDVVVDKKGNATLIFENGKKHTIPSDKLIYQIKKEDKKVSSSKTKKMKGNPRTSVSSISGVVATLLAATTGLFVSKKKDEEK